MTSPPPRVLTPRRAEPAASVSATGTPRDYPLPANRLRETAVGERPQERLEKYGSGALSDTGVDDKFMKQLGEELQPGTAALVGLVRNVNKDKLLEDVQVPGTLIHSSLSEDADAQLREALEHAGGARQPA